ncbi:hypothetical protein HUT11_35565 (plasmid) [Streptomyces seoulensis]|nr:hypothetical protein HUT11_35565 [Streptomyces seoulensis]
MSRLAARWADLERRLAQPTPVPLAGQETIPVATIAHHVYEGPGPCQAEWFGRVCGQHRDAHQYVGP